MDYVTTNNIVRAKGSGLKSNVVSSISQNN